MRSREVTWFMLICDVQGHPIPTNFKAFFEQTKPRIYVNDKKRECFEADAISVMLAETSILQSDPCTRTGIDPTPARRIFRWPPLPMTYQRRPLRLRRRESSSTRNHATQHPLRRLRNSSRPTPALSVFLQNYRFQLATVPSTPACLISPTNISPITSLKRNPPRGCRNSCSQCVHVCPNETSASFNYALFSSSLS